MATYLLDTDIIIDVLNGKRDRPVLLRNLLAEGHLLACCSISVTEIYAGLKPGEELKTSAFLQSLQYYPIDFTTARLAGTLNTNTPREAKASILPIPQLRQ